MTLAHWLESFAFDSPIERLALVLMHSLWQALLVVNLVAVMLAALSRAQPRYRHAVALTAMLLLPLFPVATWALVEPTRPAHVTTTFAPDVGLPPESAISFDRPMPVRSEATLVLITRLGAIVDNGCRRHAGWLVVAWGVGVGLLAIRFAAAWLGLSRLRREPSLPIPEFVSAQLTRLAERIHVRQTIRLCLTKRVDNPAVMGWFRPLILLPARAVTGMSADDLAHILVHELAHVARRDYPLNLVQCVIEMFFFHHPAVWWLSHRVREEREHCCDEIAIAVCGDRFAYARSLAAWEEMRPEPRPLVFTLGTRGGRLMNRIRRLLGVPSPSAGGSGTVVLAVAASAVVIAVALGSRGATAQTPKKTPGTVERETETGDENPAKADDVRDDSPTSAATSRRAAVAALARNAAEHEKADARGDEASLAELELELAEAQELDKLATAEFLLAEKLSAGGELKHRELLSRKRRQLDGQYRLHRAKRAVEKARSGQEPDASASDKMDFDYFGIAERIASQALAEVEKLANAGEASQLDVLEARREAAKAKFQFDRYKLKQSQKQGKAQAKPTQAAKMYALKHVTSDVACQLLGEWIEQTDAKAFQNKDTIRGPVRDHRTNSLIISATEADHVLIARKIDELDAEPKAEQQRAARQQQAWEIEIQLLEIDVKEAESEVQALHDSLKRLTRAEGAVSESIVIEAEAACRKAQFTWERAKLKLAAARIRAIPAPNATSKP